MSYTNFDGYFPNESIEYIYYDQLGSYSVTSQMIIAMDNRTFRRRSGTSRIALGADSSNFYVLGQSWGGILAMEYALKYQNNLKGLIISNMMASVPAYNKYAEEVLGPQLDPKVFAQIKEFEKIKSIPTQNTRNYF
jgi:proline iminopeptidase